MAVKYDCAVVAGQFDGLHPGYIDLLHEASIIAEKVIVFLHTHSPNKPEPIFSIQERHKALMACKYVDEVIIYQFEKDLFTLLENFHNNSNIVRVLDVEYKDKKFTGHELDIPIYWRERGPWSNTLVKEKMNERIQD